jgi:hypothetical protein
LSFPTHFKLREKITADSETKTFKWYVTVEAQIVISVRFFVNFSSMAGIGCIICAEAFSSGDPADKYALAIKNCGHAFHAVS